MLIQKIKRNAFLQYLIDRFHIQHYQRKVNIKKNIAKLRLLSHALANETGIYIKTNRNDR